MQSSIQAIDGAGKPVEVPLSGDLLGRPKVVLDSDARGPYPETLFVPWVGATGTGAGTTIYQSPDVSMFNTHSFQGAVGGQFNVQVSNDGTTWSGNIGFEDDTVAAPASNKIVVSKADTTSTYTLRKKARFIKVTQSGGVAASAIGSHSLA